MHSLPFFWFSCVNTAFLWINVCRLNGMAIDDRLRPDSSQNFSRSFDFFYFKLHVSIVLLRALRCVSYASKGNVTLPSFFQLGYKHNCLKYREEIMQKISMDIDWSENSKPDVKKINIIMRKLFFISSQSHDNQFWWFHEFKKD